MSLRDPFDAETGGAWWTSAMNERDRALSAPGEHPELAGGCGCRGGCEGGSSPPPSAGFGHPDESARSQGEQWVGGQWAELLLGSANLVEKAGAVLDIPEVDLSRPPFELFGKAPMPDLYGQRPPGDPGFDLCRILQPPQFTDVAIYTQRCFVASYGTIGSPSNHDWPPADCLPPCVDESAFCSNPVPDQRTRAAFPVRDFIPADFTLPEQVCSSPHPLPVDYSPVCWTLLSPSSTPLQRAFAEQAAALLVQNIDLVEWSVCFATRWARLRDQPRTPAVDDPALFTSRLVQAILEPPPTGYALYLIDDTGSNATGATTNQTESRRDQLGSTTGLSIDGGEGVVMPIGRSFWQSRLVASQAGGVAGLCAAIQLAAVVLHEAIHKVSWDLQAEHLEDSDVAADPFACWAIQNMSENSFIWAMGQRFASCLQGHPCCPKVDDLYFMSSGPGGTGDPVDKHEPYAFLPGTPC